MKKESTYQPLSAEIIYLEKADVVSTSVFAPGTTEGEWDKELSWVSPQIKA